MNGDNKDIQQNFKVLRSSLNKLEIGINSDDATVKEFSRNTSIDLCGIVRDFFMNLPGDMLTQIEKLAQRMDNVS